jgi:hypothetical protein
VGAASSVTGVSGVNAGPLMRRSPGSPGRRRGVGISRRELRFIKWGRNSFVPAAASVADVPVDAAVPPVLDVLWIVDTAGSVVEVTVVDDGDMEPAALDDVAGVASIRLLDGVTGDGLDTESSEECAESVAECGDASPVLTSARLASTAEMRMMIAADDRPATASRFIPLLGIA